jgi:hypothetical protein
MTLLSFWTKPKDAPMIERTLMGSMAALGVRHQILLAATRPQEAESPGKAEYRKCNRAERFGEQEAHICVTPEIHQHSVTA